MPVVFISAWAHELEEQLRGTQLAADDYIAVPFSLKNVVARVESVLERRGRAESTMAAVNAGESAALIALAAA